MPSKSELKRLNVMRPTTCSVMTPVFVQAVIEKNIHDEIYPAFEILKDNKRVLECALGDAYELRAWLNHFILWGEAFPKKKGKL